MARLRKGTAPKADPTFALIVAHAKAAKIHDLAAASLSRLRDRLDARKDQKGLHPERRLTCAVPLFDIGGKYDPAATIRDRNQLARHVWRAFDDMRPKLGPRAGRRIGKLEREAVAELRRRYDAFQRAHRAKRRACGLTAKEQAAHLADCAAAQALSALVGKAPATPEGRLALAKYLAGLSPGAGPWWALQAGLAHLSAALPQ
jgi:hypothetical protein